MIITTAGRPSSQQLSLGNEVATHFGGRFVERKKRSIEKMLVTYKQPLIVVSKNRFELYEKDHQAPFFFHPNSSAFRVKRMIKGEVDPLIDAASLVEGDSFLDCTLGMGSDAIVASLAVGLSGQVIGIEHNKIIAYLIKQGLETWDSENQTMNDAMRKIEVYASNHLEYLTLCESKSIDVIYFDPMFEEQINEANGIEELRQYANYSDDSIAQAVNEAKRVARKRVVFKDHFRSTRFEQLGFNVIKRHSSKQHYGFIQS
ncbi:class I SAM-dependent methyltransferase [Jeotgalibacillus marinus]|uniref:Class I SAM-dependent methyltransferase n=1 Tax=Jeotgalibacillus marinus TaxID=86667 RepID=A0ABV3Q399_9BACL